MLAGVAIDFFFGAGQEIEEQRADPGALENSCYEDVARTVAAAAATMRKEHQARCARRHEHVSFQRSGRGRDLHRALSMSDLMLFHAS